MNSATHSNLFFFTIKYTFYWNWEKKFFISMIGSYALTRSITLGFSCNSAIGPEQKNIVRRGPVQS